MIRATNVVKPTVSKKHITFFEDNKMAKLDKSSLKAKTASRTSTKMARFDLDSINVFEVPSRAEYNFVELYRMYYRPKDYEMFLREAEVEESGLSPKLRPISSPIPKNVKGAQRRTKMAQKIGSTRSSLQSIIISAASA